MVPPLGLGRSNIEGGKNITKEMVKRNILRIILERHCNKKITSARLKHNTYQKEVSKERQKEAGGIIVGKWAQRAKMTKEKWERDSQKRDIFIGFDELTVGSG